MKKYEFIEQLDANLSGMVSGQERGESIRYYRDYIEEEVRKGRTEEEVLDSLGSPFSIARSIIEANGKSSGSYEERNAYEDYESRPDSYENSSSDTRVFHAGGWKATSVLIGILLIIILIICLGFKIAMAVIPVILPFFIAWLLIKWIFRK